MAFQILNHRLALGLAAIAGYGMAECAGQETPAPSDIRKESLQLIFAEIKKGPLLVFGENKTPNDSNQEIVFLDPLIVIDRKTPDLTPPRETKFEEFVRTGTIWEKGRMRFWAKGDRGLMLELRF